MNLGNDSPATAQYTGFWEQIVSWLRPWHEVRNHPAPFVVWLCLTVVLGSVGVWLIPALGLDRWTSTIALGSLGSFCIVLLSNAIASTLIPSIPERLKFAEPGRIIGVIVAIILIVVQAGTIVKFRVVNDLSTGTLTAELLLAGLMIATAIYLLCFRLSELEPSAAFLQAQELRTVERLAAGARSAKETRSGEAL